MYGRANTVQTIVIISRRILEGFVWFLVGIPVGGYPD